MRLRVAVPASKLDLVGLEHELVFVVGPAHRLVHGGPRRTVVQVADVAELAPAIPGRVLAPASNVQTEPVAVPSTGTSNGNTVPAIRENREIGGNPPGH